MKIPSLKFTMFVFLWATACVLCFGQDDEIVVNEKPHHVNPYEEPIGLALNPHVGKTRRFRGETRSEIVGELDFPTQVALDDDGSFGEEGREQLSATFTSTIEGWKQRLLGFVPFVLGSALVTGSVNYFWGLAMDPWTFSGWVAAGTALLDGIVARLIRSPSIDIERSREKIRPRQLTITASQKKLITDVLSGTPRVLDEKGTLGYASNIRLETNFQGKVKRVSADFELAGEINVGDVVLNQDLTKTKPINPCRKFFKRLLVLE